MTALAKSVIQEGRICHHMSGIFKHPLSRAGSLEDLVQEIEIHTFWCPGQCGRGRGMKQLPEEKFTSCLKAGKNFKPGRVPCKLRCL